MHIERRPEYIPVARVEFPSVEDFRQRYDLPQIPVVITGAMNDWKAMAEWDHAWFTSFDRTPVALSLERTHTTRSRNTTVAKYAESILNETDGGHYMDQFPLESIPTLKDYVAALYAPADQANAMNLWLGPANTEISFHKDNHDPFQLNCNIFAQIRGRKRILLVSPAFDEAMYPRTPDMGAHWHSQVDHNNPDFERFPKFRDAQIQETILHPGEMLFIPGNYWHSVRALDKSVSVSCWWYTHRLVDVLTAGMRAIPAGFSFERINAADLEAFGGAKRLLQMTDMLEQKSPGTRQAILTLCQADVLELMAQA